MTVSFPEATPSQGYTKLWAATAVADQSAPKLATELNAASTVELTGYLIGNFAPSGTQNKGTQPRRLGQTGQLDKLGNANFTAPTLTYIEDPQGDDTVAANKARAALAEGTEIFLVERLGLIATAAGAVAQKTRTHHVRVGKQFFVPSGDDEFAIRQVQQETEYLEEPVEGTIAA